MTLTRLTALILFAAMPLHADEVQLSQNEHTVKIRIGDEVFAVYNLGEGYKKPFLFPIAAPGGIDRLEAELQTPPEDEFAPGNKVFVAQEHAKLKSDAGEVSAEFGEILNVTEIDRPWLKVADKNGWIHQHDVVPLKVNVTRIVDLDPPTGLDRKHPLYYDHPHHKGLWISIDEVNGIAYWAEKGTIKNAGVELLKSSGDPAMLRLINHWQDDDGQPVVVETSTISIHANRLLVYDIEFKAADKPVTFGDTKEGLFAIRLPNGMREMIAGGPVVSDAGVSGSNALWGKPAPWIDYVGPIAGRPYGVTILDDPRNFRPSRYHVRDYGLFAINPWGEKAYTGGQEEEKPSVLQPGESLKLRYGLYVHVGGVEEGRVGEAFRQFADAPQ
jgi:hypothetical protein